jgi:hypothetical protein
MHREEGASRNGLRGGAGGSDSLRLAASGENAEHGGAAARE